MMDFARHIIKRITHNLHFYKEYTLKTFVSIILLLNLGYIALGWQWNNRR